MGHESVPNREVSSFQGHNPNYYFDSASYASKRYSIGQVGPAARSILRKIHFIILHYSLP